MNLLDSNSFSALIGVVIGAMLTLLKDVLLDWRNVARNRRYAALRLFAIFELYAEQCLAAAKDKGEMRPSGSDWDERGTTVENPLLAPFPDDIVWKALDTALTYRVLRFPVQIAECERGIHFIFNEIAGPPDFDEGFEERQIGYARLGVEARKLADDLRLSCKLPFEGGESPIEPLQAIIAEIEKSRAHHISLLGSSFPYSEKDAK